MDGNGVGCVAAMCFTAGLSEFGRVEATYLVTKKLTDARSPGRVPAEGRVGSRIS